MITKRTFGRLAIAAAAATLFTSAMAADVTVAYITNGNTNEGWTLINGGAKDAAKLLNIAVPDELAMRFSYQHQQSDGYEDNVFYLDDEFGASDRDALKLSVRWHPGKNPDAQFVLSLVSDQLGGNPFANVIDHPDRGLFVRETSLNTPSFYEADRQAVALTATLALPADMVLKSTFSLQRLDLESGFDLDATPILGWFNSAYRDEQRLVEDVVLSRDVGRFAWQLGGYFESSEYTTGNSGYTFFI